MRLKEFEIEVIEDWWHTDLDIEIERNRYVVILESNVYYNHYPDGRHERRKGDKRGLCVFDKDDIDDRPTTVICPDDSDAFRSPEEAIDFLKSNGDLRYLAGEIEQQIV